MVQFLEPIITLIQKKISDTNQHLYELKQLPKNNWIKKVDLDKPTRYKDLRHLVL